VTPWRYRHGNHSSVFSKIEAILTRRYSRELASNGRFSKLKLEIDQFCFTVNTAHPCPFNCLPLGINKGGCREYTKRYAQQDHWLRAVALRVYRLPPVLLRLPGVGHHLLLYPGLLFIGWIIDLFLIPSLDRKADLRFKEGRINYTVAWVLLTFLGFLGIHRIYMGKWISGVVYFLTLGLFGAGVIYDFWTLNNQISEANSNG
jgi:hypothetical protein